MTSAEVKSLWPDNWGQKQRACSSETRTDLSCRKLPGFPCVRGGGVGTWGRGLFLDGAVKMYLVMLCLQLLVLGFVAAADLFDLSDGFEFLLDVRGLGLQIPLQAVSLGGELTHILPEVLQLTLHGGRGRIRPAPTHKQQ